MKRIASWGKDFAERALCAATIAAVLAVCFALPARADRKSDARDQFEHAVKLRTMLEGYLEKDRTLPDYRQTISAYHKVYLISTQAEEVTPSLVAEGELYQEMGRLFDPKYSNEGDIHVWPDDYIEWAEVAEVMVRNGCAPVFEEDYLLYRSLYRRDVYDRFKDRCVDTRVMVFRREAA